VSATLATPGLYLQRAETPRPALGSAISGIVGVAERGPINSPQPLTSWGDYSDTFGGFVPFGFLAQSVFGFFRNGGEKCWVVRIADTSRIGATTPPGNCMELTPLAAAAAPFTDHNGEGTVRISALDPGSWGNRLAVRVATSALRPLRVGTLTRPTTMPATQLELDSIVDLRPGLVVRITNPDGVSGGVVRTIALAAGALNPATRRVDLSTSVGQVFLTGSVVYAAGFRIEAAFRGRRESFDPLSMRPGHPRYFMDVINAPPTMSDYGERRRNGLSSLIFVEHLLSAGGASRFRPSDTAGDRRLAGGDDGFMQARATFRDNLSNPLVTIVAKGDRGSAGNGLQVVAQPFQAQLSLPSPDENGARNRLVVDRINGFQAGESVRVGPAGGVTSETATPDLVDSGSMTLRLPGDLANAHAIGEPVAVAGRFTLEARRPGEREPIEVIPNLSGNVATGTRFIRPALQSESATLCASTPPAPFTTPIVTGDSASITLTGGADPGMMDARYYTGYQPDGSYFHPAESPVALIGVATLERVEEVSLVSVPDLVRVATSDLVAAQTNVLRHCARLGDRFALIDAPAATPPATIEGRSVTPAPSTEDWVMALGDAELRKYGAAFHPWVRGTFDEHEHLTPPSALVAGLIARTDAARGVDKAPANEQLKGAFRLEPPVDRARHGELNPLGINCVVKLEDGELRLMGARTLSEDAVARYINVRRTILSVKRTLAQRMRWAVFEPINDALFRRLEATLVTYLQALLARGVTASQRPAEAFYVRCNGETNPPDQQRLGIVVAEIGLALLAPAEFIVLTARRTPDAIQVIEEEA
jgi:hypothetical protein